MKPTQKIISKAIATIAICTPLTMTPMSEAHAENIICSNGISQMATSMGLDVFNMMSSIPFFGSFFNSMGTSMAGSFFSAVLDSPTMTLEMINCAKGNSGMIDMMIQVIDANPALLDKMAVIMEQSPAFTEAFTDLALSDSVLAKFFFTHLTSNLYKGLTVSMVNSTTATRNVASLMKSYATKVMPSDTKFYKFFYNLGATTSTCDSNELSHERFFYAVFSDITAANSFLAALGTLDAATQKTLLAFIFQAKVPSSTGTTTQHITEKYNFNYAIMKAFVKGVAPSYDQAQAPDPASKNPANALFGNVLGFMMTTSNGQQTPSENGMAFFQAMMAGATDPTILQLMQFLGGLKNPSTGSNMFPPELFGMIPAPDAGAPAPRDFKTNTACSTTTSTGTTTGSGSSTGGTTSTNTTNYLLNVSTTAYSYSSSSYKANDGSNSSYWKSSPIYSSSQTDKVYFNLSSAKSFSSVKVNFAYPCTYKIEGQTSGGSTVTLGSGTASSTNTFYTVNFSAQTLQSVKVTMSGGTYNSYYGINEAQGY